MNKGKNKGITLIALVVSIIVLLILAGIFLSLVLGEEGIIQKTIDAKNETEKAAFFEKLRFECIGLKDSEYIKDKDDKEIFEIIKNNLNMDDADFKIHSKCMHITTKQGWQYTVSYELTAVEGIEIYLDIADGSIDLKSNGYIQNNQPLVEYNGKYVITGTTTENVIRVMEEGTYNVVLKDINIDVAEKKYRNTSQGYCAFNANRGAKPTACFVNIILEGNNVLIGGVNSPGLGFSKAKPNIDGEKNGSTLTIDGDGSLQVKAGSWASAIGSGYTGFEASPGDVSNIIINGGNIEAIATINGTGIGSALHASVNNIIINGGNIIARGGNGSGIGVRNKSADNIIINGGNIEAYGSDFGSGIGGGDSGSLKITGGNIYSTTRSPNYSAIGNKCTSIKIEGGTIRAYSKNNTGIYGKDNNVEITGGNIYLNGLGDVGTKDNKNFIENKPLNGEEALYLNKIKIPNVGANQKIESLTINDQITYGINDVYTLQDDENTGNIDETGMLYLYLPRAEETRIINVKVNGRVFSGELNTGENNDIILLQ